jgi:hypothetical protein
MDMDIANTQRLSLTKKIGAHYQNNKKNSRLPFNDKAADAMSYIVDKELKRMESYTIATAHYV